MEDNPNNPHSPSTSKPMTNEIDDLLAEAEALSNEIASGVVATVETPPVHLEAERFSTAPDLLSNSGEPAPLLPRAPEPIQALEDVQAKADDLKDLLNDPDAGKSADAAKELTPTSGTEKPKSTSKKGSKFNLPKPAVEQPTPAPAPKPVKVEPNPVVANPTTAKSETPAATNAAHNGSAAGTGGIKKIFGKIARGAVGGMKSVVAVLLNSMLAVLAVLDWPFRAFPPRVKSAIGLAGLVTLFMGMMSWVMPGMMHSNPFENMEIGIATKGGKPPAAAEGHGEEAAAPAGHGEAAAAEHSAPAAAHH